MALLFVESTQHRKRGREGKGREGKGGVGWVWVWVLRDWEKDTRKSRRGKHAKGRKHGGNTRVQLISGKESFSYS